MTPTAICFGEVLWDIFPNENIIGGAPLNVALRMQSLGIDARVVSKVGKDKLGDDIIQYLKNQDCRTNFIQQTNQYETGKVIVELDSSGSANYEIAQPSAWDDIDCPKSLIETIRQTDLFLYGSLAARSLVSRNSLMKMLQVANFNVFDVNLRPPFFNEELLVDLMKAADFIKFNEEELVILSGILKGPTNTLEAQIRFMANKTQTKSICVTLGAKGAILLHEGIWFNQKGFPTQVVDTVGAGDSFLGMLLSGVLQKKNIADALMDACAMGAMVAGYAGANPKISHEALQKFKALHV